MKEQFKPKHCFFMAHNLYHTVELLKNKGLMGYRMQFC